MIDIINLGKINYKDALEKQINLVESLVKNSESKESIIICSHSPVVTLGRKSLPEDLQGWNGETHEVSRGGRVTYHGPGQTIVYPILNLKKRNQDLGGYIRKLEKVIVDTLKTYSVESRGDINNTGVWVKSQKIASIGIAVKRWITYHGLAFNLFKDPTAFQGINPCGFTSETMTSLEEVLKRKPSRSEFEKRLTSFLTNELNHLNW